MKKHLVYLMFMFNSVSFADTYSFSTFPSDLIGKQVIVDAGEIIETNGQDVKVKGFDFWKASTISKSQGATFVQHGGRLYAVGTVVEATGDTVKVDVPNMVEFNESNRKYSGSSEVNIKDVVNPKKQKKIAALIDAELKSQKGMAEAAIKKAKGLGKAGLVLGGATVVGTVIYKSQPESDSAEQKADMQATDVQTSP